HHLQMSEAQKDSETCVLTRRLRNGKERCDGPRLHHVDGAVGDAPLDVLRHAAVESLDPVRDAGERPHLLVVQCACSTLRIWQCLASRASGGHTTNREFLVARSCEEDLA